MNLGVGKGLFVPGDELFDLPECHIISVCRPCPQPGTVGGLAKLRATLIAVCASRLPRKRAMKQINGAFLSADSG